MLLIMEYLYKGRHTSVGGGKKQNEASLSIWSAVLFGDNLSSGSWALIIQRT